MMRKRILALFVALVLCLGLAGVARADLPETWNDALKCQFDEDSGLLTITGDGPLVVENEGLGDSVPVPWIGYKEKIKELVIGDGVTVITGWAFEDCTNLSKVTLSDTVEWIEAGAFKNCTSLTSISIPDSVTQIAMNAFDGCSSLPSITIPKGVVGDLRGNQYGPLFAGCTSLRSIHVDEENAAYSSIDGVLFDKDKTTLFRIPAGSTLKTYTVPDGVTDIWAKAFEDCDSLTEVILPDSLDRIWDSAFHGCSGLTTLVLPDSVTKLGSGSMYDSWIFKGCSSLTNISIPNGIKYIGASYFAECSSLAAIYIPSSVTEIRRGAFEKCDKLKDVYYGGTEEQWKSVSKRENNEVLTSATIHYNASALVEPAAEPEASVKTISAAPTASTVLVNGEKKAFDAYNIDGSNYFKLRDLAYVLSGTEKQFEVGWDNDAKAISLTSGAAYTAVGGEMTGKGSGNQTANPSSAKIILNGEDISLTAYEIGGNNYFKLRDIGQTFDFGIGWDSASKTITIDTSTGYTAE